MNEWKLKELNFGDYSNKYICILLEKMKHVNSRKHFINERELKIQNCMSEL